MKAVRHEMPGKLAKMIGPVRNGCDPGRQILITAEGHRTRLLTDHTVPYGMSSLMAHFQAFHAWLPS
jgi:hypothetical protein